jgi:hypothetical protein
LFFSFIFLASLFPTSFSFILSWLLFVLFILTPYFASVNRQIANSLASVFNQSFSSPHTHPALCATVETHITCYTIHFPATYLIHAIWPAGSRRVLCHTPTPLYEEHKRSLFSMLIYGSTLFCRWHTLLLSVLAVFLTAIMRATHFIAWTESCDHWVTPLLFQL